MASDCDGHIRWAVVPGKNNDVHIELTWKISDLKDIPEMYSGYPSDFVKTPLKTDKDGETEWNLIVHQINKTEEYKLELVGRLFTDNVTARANFSIQDKDGKTKLIKRDVEIQSACADYVAGNPGKFLNPQGPITIFCEIFIKDVEARKKENQMVELLVNAKDFHSDVTLLCEDGQVVDCHKNILCLNSSYFKVFMS